MLTDPMFYLVAVPAVIILGLAKGGLTGVGVLGGPLMALAVSPVQAAAIALPILIIQDLVSVAAFRHNRDGRILALMLPGAIGGVALDFALAAWVSSATVVLLYDRLCLADRDRRQAGMGRRHWTLRRRSIPSVSRRANAPLATHLI